MCESMRPKKSSKQTRHKRSPTTPGKKPGNETATEMPSWFGGLKAYAKGKPHDMDSIRESIAKGRARELERRYGKVRR
jgi:hypothetical protein